jgi:hypothetical protein
MKAAVVLFAALVFAFVALGQGQFFFDNRILPEVDARFVLCTDPPGTSSVGFDYQVQLFGGPPGTPLDQLKPLAPPSTTFRGAAGSPGAGYVLGVTVTVPGSSLEAIVLVRAFQGESWDSSPMRFERVFTTQLKNEPGPPNIPLGTSPLVLCNIPEPPSLALAVIGVGAFVCWPILTHRRRLPLSRRTTSFSPGESI